MCWRSAGKRSNGGLEINYGDNMAESLKAKTAKGVLWSSIERFSVQFVQLVIQILIARILTPNDFGIIGMLAIFIAVAQSFIDSGFSNALIRKTDRTETDNSTVFYFNIVVGIFFYAILYFTAPAIADFYDTPILIPITRVLALGIVFNSLAIVQRAILTARVDFKTQANASLVAVTISGLIGLWMAYNGYGVWSLAWQTVINGAINTLMLWILTNWYPRLAFSWKSFKELFSFGSKLLLSGLLNTIYSNVYTIVIGKIFSKGDLGFYTKANQLASFPSSNLTGIMQRVTYPLLCDFQNDDERLRYTYRKYLRLSAFIIFPLMVGFAAVAEPFIIALLTPKWSGAVVLLQILCFALMWYPIHAINLNFLQVKGRSDLFLRLEIIKKVIGVCILCITIPLGLTWMCVGQIVSSFVCLGINTHYTGKLIDLGFWKQMKDLMPALLTSLSMGVFVYLSTLISNVNALKVLIGIVVGVSYYYGINKITKSPELNDLTSLVKLRKQYRNG